MTFPKARLVVSACLFLGWLGILYFLWYRSPGVVLSRPQFLVAQAYVVVEVKSGERDRPDSHVRVDKVLWPERLGLDGQVLDLREVASCSKASGYVGPGLYLIPIMKSANSWVVTPLPRVTFFPREKPTHGTLEAAGIFGIRTAWRLPFDEALKVKEEWEAIGFDRVSLRAEELRIYAWGRDAESQVSQFIAAKK